MSSTVRSYGVMGVLIAPVPNEGDYRYELGEKLWDDKSPLSFNHEGTLVYLDFNRHADYREREDFYGLQFIIQDDRADVLIAEAAKYGLTVDPVTIRPYNCVWYNGSDSDMDVLTKQNFLTRTNQ